jgi:hypothetical protein
MRDAGSVPALTADMVQSLRDAIKLLTVLCKADAAVSGACGRLLFKHLGCTERVGTEGCSWSCARGVLGTSIVVPCGSC